MHYKLGMIRLAETGIFFLLAQQDHDQFYSHPSVCKAVA